MASFFSKNSKAPTHGMSGALLVMASALAPTPAVAKIKDWAITPKSAESVVIVQMDREPFAYELRFSREGQGGFGRRIFALGVKPSEFATYTARTFKPGTYVLNSIVQQGAWSTCFTKGTLAFTIQPGRIYYLGAINSRELLAELQQSATARGRTRLTAGALAIGWEPQIQPTFSQPGEAELAMVRQFVAANMPKSTAKVESLAGTAASFTATGGERAVQVCG